MSQIHLPLPAGAKSEAPTPVAPHDFYYKKMIGDVRHFAELGTPMPIRNNVSSAVSNAVDRARPDRLNQAMRGAGEAASEAWKTKGRLAANGVAGAGSGAAGSAIGAKVMAATAAKAAVGVTVAGTAAAALVVGVAGYAAMSGYQNWVKKKVRKKIHEMKTVEASEKELHYLLSHGELQKLAQTFKKMIDAEAAFRAKRLAVGTGRPDCRVLLDLTYHLYYWHKKIHTSLREGPRLISLQQFQGLIVQKIEHGLTSINEAAAGLLKFAKIHGENVHLAYGPKYKVCALPDSPFDWKAMTTQASLTPPQCDGLAFILDHARPITLTDQMTKDLRAICDKINPVKASVGTEEAIAFGAGIPPSIASNISSAYLDHVMSSVVAHQAAGAGIAGAAAPIAATSATGAGFGAVIGFPVSLVVNYVANHFDEKESLGIVNNKTIHDCAVKVEHLANLLKLGRINILHEGYEALERNIPQIGLKIDALPAPTPARRPEAVERTNPTLSEYAHLRKADELATVMYDSILHCSKMTSTIVVVNAMLGIIEKEVKEHASRWIVDDGYFEKYARGHLTGPKHSCQCTCYHFYNWHPLIEGLPSLG